MYQVYLIDDEPWVLIGLERLILWEKYGFCVVGKSTSSREAWGQIVEKKARCGDNRYSNAWSKWTRIVRKNEKGKAR